MPRRIQRTAQTNKANNMYGTTLRVRHPSIQAWLITWINPVTGHREEQIGHRIGNDIVQVGARRDATPTRWRFMKPPRIPSTGSAQSSPVRTVKAGRLEGEFRAKRTCESVSEVYP